MPTSSKAGIHVLDLFRGFRLYAWAPACLACVYDLLTRMWNKPDCFVNGPVTLIEVWAISRCNIGLVGPHDKLPFQYPMANIWAAQIADNRRIASAVSIAAHLDGLKHDSFHWTPYAVYKEEFNKCYPDSRRDIFRYNTVLINFWTVARHNAHRVMKQFRLLQVVPVPSVKQIPPIVRQTGGKCDWRERLRPYVEEWNARAASVITGNIDEDCCRHREEYIEYFLRIKRQNVSYSPPKPRPRKNYFKRKRVNKSDDVQGPSGKTNVQEKPTKQHTCIKEDVANGPAASFSSMGSFAVGTMDLKTFIQHIKGLCDHILSADNGPSKDVITRQMKQAIMHFEEEQTKEDAPSTAIMRRLNIGVPQQLEIRRFVADKWRVHPQEYSLVEKVSIMRQLDEEVMAGCSKTQTDSASGKDSNFQTKQPRNSYRCQILADILPSLAESLKSESDPNAICAYINSVNIVIGAAEKEPGLVDFSALSNAISELSNIAAKLREAQGQEDSYFVNTEFEKSMEFAREDIERLAARGKSLEALKGEIDKQEAHSKAALERHELTIREAEEVLRGLKNEYNSVKAKLEWAREDKEAVVKLCEEMRENLRGAEKEMVLIEQRLNALLADPEECRAAKKRFLDKLKAQMDDVLVQIQRQF